MNLAERKSTSKWVVQERVEENNNNNNNNNDNNNNLAKLLIRDMLLPVMLFSLADELRQPIKRHHLWKSTQPVNK